MTDLPLYSRRRRLERNAELQTDGELVFTDIFESTARVRLHAVADQALNGWNDATRRSVRTEADRLLRIEAGVGFTALGTIQLGENEDVVSAIEAFWRALSRRGSVQADAFAADINVVLSEHLIAFELIEGMMVPVESRHMHEQVVKPALTLLARAEWNGVESAYHDALREAPNHPADAITDAARALEVTLRELGCTGNTLGALAQSARTQGLLQAYDTKLYDWIAAERGNRSDAHGAFDPDLASSDAWRVVHVVGAEILHLVEAAERSADRKN